MGDLSDIVIDAANARGALVLQSEPHAASTRYDWQLDRVIVELTNGCTFIFPPRMAQGLEHATQEQLAEVAVLGLGYGLHWEALDVDLSIPGLMAGIFGTKAYMAGHAAAPERSQPTGPDPLLSPKQKDSNVMPGPGRRLA